MPIQLGAPIVGARRPSFHASLDGQMAIVELDSGAMFRLISHATTKELADILEEKRDMIQDAATRLIDDGFVTVGADGVETLITALDL